MRVGYFLSCEEYPPEQLVEQAAAAETAGFDALWISDHFHPWNNEQAQSPFVWSVIGAISQACSLPVTTAVTCPTVRTHPAVIAQAAATSARMLRGRFVLGVGTGEALNEHILGDAWPTADVRLAMLEEAVTIMRALWTGEPVTYDGRFFQLKDAQQRPTPTRPIPILIGGVGPRTLELVRAHADWWNVPVHGLDKLDERRGHAGDARVSMQIMVALLAGEADRAPVTELLARRFGGSPMGKTAIVGTADEVAERFRALRAAGIERFYVWFSDFAPPETHARFGEVIASVDAPEPAN